MSTPSVVGQPGLVSIVIVTYRRVDLLRQTVAALRAQIDHPHYEIVVTDDASPAAVQDEMRRLPIDVFVSGTRNEGIGANTNRGIAAAKGEYILQVQDDWVLRPSPGLLQRSIAVLEAAPDVAFVRFYDIAGFPEWEERSVAPGVSCRVVLRSERNLLHSNFLYSDTPHLKRAGFHRELGPYRTGLRMEATETEFAERFLRETALVPAYFPEFVGAFTHIGEETSFRTRQLKYRLHRLASASAPGRAALATWRWMKNVITTR